MLLHAWLRPLLVGLSLSVSICGGSWAARLLWTAIEWKVETLAALNLDIEQARQTLTEMRIRLGGWRSRSTGSGSWCGRPAR